MRHFKWDFQGKFEKTAVLAFFEPGSLVDQLLDAFFLESIDIGLLCLHQLLEFTSPRLRVTVEEIFPEQVFAAIGLKRFDGFVIHEQDDTLGITDGDCTRKTLKPGRKSHGNFPF